ncbi:serine/threonine-protein kinase Nek7 isoform X5 [Myotis myotis]|uniref:serine/threonine-protein kinase Nek7 isoform X5 n=1 Tax=Myotis myotis TaxID=51298 RepID=UPI001749277C|nr:serine/threonine-protein kinase Nek7 isoform X5 [Myotis myotis]
MFTLLTAASAGGGAGAAGGWAAARLALGTRGAVRGGVAAPAASAGAARREVAFGSGHRSHSPRPSGPSRGASWPGRPRARPGPLAGRRTGASQLPGIPRMRWETSDARVPGAPSTRRDDSPAPAATETGGSAGDRADRQPELGRGDWSGFALTLPQMSEPTSLGDSYSSDPLSHVQRGFPAGAGKGGRLLCLFKTESFIKDPPCPPFNQPTNKKDHCAGVCVPLSVCPSCTRGPRHHPLHLTAARLTISFQKLHEPMFVS